jgi:hypothetical protein
VLIALTDRQIAELKTIAAAIPGCLRAVFTQQLAELLRERTNPGDGDVWRAARQAAQEIMHGGAAPKQPQTGGEVLRGFGPP